MGSENIVRANSLSRKIFAFFIIVFIDLTCDQFSNFFDYKKGFNDENALNQVNENLYVITGLMCNT